MVQKLSTVDDALALAAVAHRNQRDKSGLPYIAHPYRVWAAVEKQGADDNVQIAAILHDVTEDSTFTCTMLQDLGFPKESVDMIRLLDRNESEKTFGFGSVSDNVSDHYYYCIRRNPGALMIKLADIADNLMPSRLERLDEKTQKRLKRKYAKALEMLGGDTLRLSGEDIKTEVIIVSGKTPSSFERPPGNVYEIDANICKACNKDLAAENGFLCTKCRYSL